MKPFHRTLTALVLLLIAHVSSVVAQTPVRLFVLADSVSVGDRFRVAIVLERPGDAVADVPDPALGDSTLGDLEILGLERFSEPVPDEPGRVRDSLAYEVTTFALDTALVPPQRLELVAGSDTTVLFTPDAYVPVRSLVPPDAQDVQDIAPIVEFRRDLWPWILLAGIVLLAAVVGYMLYRRRAGRAEPEPPPPPPVPPYEEAMQRLERLQQMDLEHAENVKPYYVELSDVLRTYLERRTGLPALESTTRELVRKLERSQMDGFPSTAVARVRMVLERSDLVKFADMRPASRVGREVAAETRLVIDEVERLKKSAETETSVNTAEG